MNRATNVQAMLISAAVHRLRRALAGAAWVALVVLATPVHAAQVDMTYSVAFRGVAVSEQTAFAHEVARTYADPRGWSLGGRVMFRQERGGGDFTIWLAAAAQMQSFSADCSAQWSCRVGRDVVINETRWESGSPYWRGALAGYRSMLINHETGHFLGLDHEACPGVGLLAPVMMQQSKGPAPCLPNAWPLPEEQAHAAALLGVQRPSRR